MNIPDDLKELYEEFRSPYYEIQAIYLAQLPRKQLLALIERIARAEQALAKKDRVLQIVANHVMELAEAWQCGVSNRNWGVVKEIRLALANEESE